MAMSVVNRVRFTAWAWLASSFLLGTTTGVLAVGVPLWNQLQAARDDAARLEQVENLTRRVEPGADIETLASLEEPPRARGPHPVGGKTSDPMPPAPVLEQPLASAPVARVNVPAAETVLAVAAPAVAPQPPAIAAPQGPSEAERKAGEARKTAQVAEDAERKAKAERQAKLELEQKLEREQKLAKAAQEAQQKKDREREQAEARAAAARAKPAMEVPVRKEPPVQLAAPVPSAGTNGPTERVTKDEAGLSEIQASGVTFKSGRRVAVGDSFPSGEKLVSADPGIGEIITSKRRIVIKPTP